MHKKLNHLLPLIHKAAESTWLDKHNYRISCFFSKYENSQPLVTNFQDLIIHTHGIIVW